MSKTTESQPERVEQLTESQSDFHASTRTAHVNLLRWTSEWDKAFADLVHGVQGEQPEAGLIQRWLPAFPLSYRETFTPAEAMGDALAVESILAAGIPGPGQRLLSFYSPGEMADTERLKIFSAQELFLDDLIPPLRDMGITVTDERPYLLVPIGLPHVWLYDLGIKGISKTGTADDVRSRIQDAVLAVWAGKAESDPFHTLISTDGFSWRDALLLRAYFRYLRQAGVSFSPERVSHVLGAEHHVARHLANYFGARFDPNMGGNRGEAMASTVATIEQILDDITGRDDDQIIRSFLEAIKATVRTNFYQPTATGQLKNYVSFKIASPQLPLLPHPRPEQEIWVYSAAVEGVHLRFGSIARGGLRWSDRREDFRTEVLGLVKAQVIKNAVIVPTGAKGCFYTKTPAGTVPADIPGLGREAYRLFIHGLLDLTDNIALSQGAHVLHPEGVIRYDSDDPYLVVAADKGTARFSDLANEIAAEHNYWLGDAFASGGSVGYDHKAMGITARGAWESTRRHLREMNFALDSAVIDTIGIGDMSGDVFGNGMLYTDKIALKAAFDHRHIFIDPSPDAARTFRERSRLFAMERSSWDDFNRDVLSPGGGIFSRQSKILRISPEAALVLGHEGSVTMTPDELIKVILRAPSTLLFNGGVGTYVKHQSESHAEVSDKANDTVRVNADELRVEIIGEGGNLGVTPRGRIQAAISGVRVNTDAIDNSAGVDCSDHEVNIKILLDRAVAAGDVNQSERSRILEIMTDDVAKAVLANNYEQNFALGTTVGHTASMTRVYSRAMRDMESKGRLHRQMDSLPTDDEILRRLNNGTSLTRPEISVLLAHMKSSLSEQILASTIPDERWAQEELLRYFPEILLQAAGKHLNSHPLKREIISTSLANKILNHAGITFVYRLCEETGASEADAVRAYFISAGIWEQPEFFNQIRGLDGTVTTVVQDQLDRSMRRLLDRSSRWFLKNQIESLDVIAEIEKFRQPLTELSAQLYALVQPNQLQDISDAAAAFELKGVPSGLARESAALLYRYPLLDIAQSAFVVDVSPAALASTYFDLFEQIEGRRLLSRIDTLPRNDAWETMARAALREDFYDVLSSAALTLTLKPQDEAAAASRRPIIAGRLKLVSDALSELSNRPVSTNRDFEILTIVLRALRGLRTEAFTPR